MQTKPPTEFDVDRVASIFEAAKTSGGAHLTPNEAAALMRLLVAAAKKDPGGTFEMLEKLIGLGNRNADAWTAVRDQLRAEVAS